MTETWSDGVAADPATERFPWPPPDDDGGVLSAFGATWKGATFDPSAFFARVPRSGGTGAAVLYYMVIGILVAGASLFWDMLTRGSGLADEAVAEELGIMAVDPVVGFLLSPLILLVGLVVAAGLVHLVLLMVGGAAHGFGTSLRVFCYAYSPMIFGVVPVIGTLIGAVWMLAIAIIGLRDAHGAPTWKPAVAVLIPFILAAGFMILAFMAVIAAAGGLG